MSILRSCQVASNSAPPSPSAYAAMLDGIDLETAVVAVQTGTIQAAHIASMRKAYIAVVRAMPTSHSSCSL